MPPRPIIFDGLWNCLCPPLQSAAAGGRFFRSLEVVTAHRTSLHCISTIPTRAQSRSYNPPVDADKTPGPPNIHFEDARPTFRSPRRNADAERERTSLVHLTTFELYERLRSDAAVGRHDDVMNIIKILIKDRRERPNVRLYSAVIHSYVSPTEGTAGKIRRVLDEMTEAGVELDIACCHNTLEVRQWRRHLLPTLATMLTHRDQALAVHPDYLLRNEILEYMKERWFTLTDRGHNMVVAGLLRDRLFEQAIEKIEDMLRQRVLVASWLWDKALWSLLDYQEVDEAWHLVQLRQQAYQGSRTLSVPLWTHFLDVSSRLCHAESVNTIWDNQVVPAYLKPATATCLNVLSLAGRTGNVKLATDVFRILSERDTVLTSHHYEMLLEAYLNAKDLNAAISVIVIMNESGIKVDEAAIHPLYMFLHQDAAVPLQAFGILQDLESSGRRIPTAAVNACIQASVHLAKLEEAIEIYKALHTVSHAGPNTQTFNILFQGCHRAGRKELAMFLAEEMIKLDIEPNALTYDRLVLVCCHANDLEDAFSYYEEMRSMGFVPRRGTYEVLLDKGITEGDERTPAVLKDMKANGIMPRNRKEVERNITDRFVHKSDISGEESGKDSTAHVPAEELQMEIPEGRSIN